MSNVSKLDMPLLRFAVEGTPLTPRERDVLRRLAMGDTMPEIAQRFGKSHETIKSQAKMARARLGARTSTHAVAIAISLDLI